MSDTLTKLSEIQLRLKVGKQQKNKFGNYNYRSCGDILEAVKPLLTDCALILTDELVLIGDRYYIKSAAIFRHDKDEVVSTGYAREELSKKGMDASQITGSASSYARKYALNGLFSIDDTEDSDATNDHAEKPAPEPDESTVATLYEAANKSKGDFLKAWKETSSDMRATITPELMDKFKALCDG